MSLVFNAAATDKNGIIQMIEDKCGFNDGDISGNTLRMQKFTAKCNNGIDAAFAIIFKAGGTKNHDDPNHTKYNIIYLDIVSGQRDYSYTTDEQGNLILEVYKIFRQRSSGGVYEEISPVDTSSENVRPSFYDGLGVVGIPTQYDETANGILFDIIPNYSATSGIMIYINREGSYFLTSDTTKKPGFAGLFHRYIAVFASHDYGRLNLPVNKFKALEEEKMQLERDMYEWYGQREKNIRPVMRGKMLNPRTGRYSGEEI